jgi:transposase
MYREVASHVKHRSHRHPSATPRTSPAALDHLNPNAAGLDCGSATHVVAVPPDRDPQPVQTFATFTGDLHRLADWLIACRITHVAMEATGVYWIPIFELLEERGLTVSLVNARHVKHVPGRKSDVSDAEWLRDLHIMGLLRGSFRPADEIVALRAYLRHRSTLIEGASAHVQRMQKALVQMNVQLALVVSDITGVTGMRILRDIVAGQRDPKVLARHRDYRCKASEAEITAALTGHYRPEHVLVLAQHLALYDAYQQQLTACDIAIEAHLAALAAPAPEPAAPLPPPRGTRRPAHNNEPAFEVRTPLHRLTGTDLSQIDGIGPYTALRLISEIGVEEHPNSRSCEQANSRTLLPVPSLAAPSMSDPRRGAHDGQVAEGSDHGCEGDGGSRRVDPTGGGTAGRGRVDAPVSAQAAARCARRAARAGDGARTIGTDMSRWPTEHHFTSWLTLAPRNKISGGRLLSSRTQPSANRAAVILRMAAMTLGRSSTALGAFYRRLSSRTGKAKAITATARKLAILVYRTLKGELVYADPGADAYDAQHRTQLTRRLRHRAAKLGFALISLETGEVLQP